MAEPAPILIATIRKNSREEFRVSIAEYHGTRFLDVRTYVDGKGDERVPTPKGIAIRPDALPALLEALEAARQHPALG